jgi:hypothetical protein
VDYIFVQLNLRAVSKTIAPTCEKNVQIKLTPKNFLLIIFNVVYIEVNVTRKKLYTDKQYIFKNLLLNTNWPEKHVSLILVQFSHFSTRVRRNR